MNAHAEPTEPSAERAQAAIAGEFAFFGDWTERYQYLIDLGRKLAPLPDALKIDEFKITGCQSQVWLVPSGDAQRIDFVATSDSSIVSGLIALLLRVYSGRPAIEILATERPFQAPVATALERPRGLAGEDHAVRARNVAVGPRPNGGRRQRPRRAADRLATNVPLPEFRRAGC